VAYGLEMRSTKRDLCCLDMICKISSRNDLGIWRLHSHIYGCIINASGLVHIQLSSSIHKNAMKSSRGEIQLPKISIKQIPMQQSLTSNFYSQFLSLANSRIDLYAFNNPCSERSTLTLLISVVGGFVILEQIFAASVSKIILSLSKSLPMNYPSSQISSIHRATRS